MTVTLDKTAYTLVYFFQMVELQKFLDLVLVYLDLVQSRLPFKKYQVLAHRNYLKVLKIDHVYWIFILYLKS